MSRDISVKKDKKVDLGHGAWVHVRRLFWGEVEDINAEARDAKTGKVNEKKRLTLCILRSVTDFGGFTEGEKKLTHSHDLKKVVEHLYIEDATKIYVESVSDHAEAEGELGN